MPPSAIIFKVSGDEIAGCILSLRYCALLVVVPEEPNATRVQCYLARPAKGYEALQKQYFSGYHDKQPFFMVGIADFPQLSHTVLLRYASPGHLFSFNCFDEDYALLKFILQKLLKYMDLTKKATKYKLYLMFLQQHITEVLQRDSGFTTREAAIVKQFMTLLFQNPYPVRKVAWYADQLFVSRRYLTRAVRVGCGQTPKSMIDQQLIAAAKDLLRTAATVGAIAELLHFESTGSFSTFFKKHSGTTPGTFRNASL